MQLDRALGEGQSTPDLLVGESLGEQPEHIRLAPGDAAEHDSQVLDDILDGDNTALGVWADSAYRSAEIEASLKEKGLRSEREKQGNKTRSSVRVRVEHVFGAQSNDMGGTLVRSVGLVRAKARIGLKNLAYAPPGPTGSEEKTAWGRS